MAVKGETIAFLEKKPKNRLNIKCKFRHIWKFDFTHYTTLYCIT